MVRKIFFQERVRVIVKVGDNKFVKYRCYNLLRLQKFLDEHWQGWRWVNVYNKAGEQIGNFTNKTRL